MIELTAARERFARFSSARLECPLCGSSNVEYEFVLNRSAFSSCSECALRFVKRPAAESARASSTVPLETIRTLVAAYAGAPVAGLSIAADLAQPETERVAARPDAIVFTDGIAGDDPLATLESIVKTLASDGTIVFALPSTSSPAARRNGPGWRPLQSGHRYFFNPDNLQLLATRAGLGDFVTIVDARDLPSSDKATAAWFRSHFLLLARPVKPAGERLLSVIFPVYNEAATVVESLDNVLGKQIPGIDIEVIVVESNSTDGSRALVERYRDHERVKLVFEDRPRGKGHAVRTGLRHASGEVILFQDADLEYDVGDYDCLVEPLFDLRRNFVLGSRHNRSGAAWKIRHFADQPGISTIANLAHVVLLAMFNTLYKQRLRDPFTMYKVFRRDCLYGLEFECNRFDFDFEINIMLLRKGYQPFEIPVNYLSRSFAEGKKVSFFGDPPTWVRAMLRLRRKTLYPALTKAGRAT